MSGGAGGGGKDGALSYQLQVNPEAYAKLAKELKAKAIKGKR